MGYIFRGVLTSCQAAAASLARRWPTCEVGRDCEQFEGFIVRFPCENDLHPMQGEEAYEQLLEELAQLNAALPQLSAEFPKDTIVYVEVECFGGACVHNGKHFLGGDVTGSFEDVDLAEVLRPMNVALEGTRHFKPFTRGYFDRDSLQNWNRPWPPAANNGPNADG